MRMRIVEGWHRSIRNDIWSWNWLLFNWLSCLICWERFSLFREKGCDELVCEVTGKLHRIYKFIRVDVEVIVFCDCFIRSIFERKIKVILKERGKGSSNPNWYGSNVDIDKIDALRHEIHKSCNWIICKIFEKWKYLSFVFYFLLRRECWCTW